MCTSRFVCPFPLLSHLWKKPEDFAGYCTCFAFFSLSCTDWTAAGSPEGDRAALGRWRDSRGYPVSCRDGVQFAQDGRVERLDLGRKQIKCGCCMEI